MTITYLTSLTLENYCVIVCFSDVLITLDGSRAEHFSIHEILGIV